MLFDFFVEQRLSDCGIVNFAVTVAAVADQIDHNIGAELVAIFGGQAGDTDNGVHIFSVDVEDGDRLAARDAGGKARGVLFEIAGGESEQVVDDHVNGAADGVAGKVGIVHGFGEDALSGESGVAVDKQRKVLFAATFAGAILLGAGAADGDRIDRFQVAGI